MKQTKTRGGQSTKWHTYVHTYTFHEIIFFFNSWLGNTVLFIVETAREKKWFSQKKLWWRGPKEVGFSAARRLCFKWRKWIRRRTMSSHFCGGHHLWRNSLWTLMMNSSKQSPPKPRGKQKVESWVRSLQIGMLFRLAQLDYKLILYYFP